MVDSWAERADRHQTILNARAIPARRAQRALHPEPAIEARIVWEVDGEELVRTVATAFTTRLVLIHLSDARWPTLGVWLSPGDVRRLGS